jgi:hypothetical protein
VARNSTLFNRNKERKFQSIPVTLQGVDPQLSKVIRALTDAVERRLLTRSNEKMMSRQDLIDLGIVTQAQVDNLDKTEN